jgi:hypothetical protein
VEDIKENNALFSQGSGHFAAFAKQWFFAACG